MEALRHTRGDAQQALLNELDAMHLNQALVDSLVHEYASFRCTLRPPSQSSPPQSKLAKCLLAILLSLGLM